MKKNSNLIIYIIVIIVIVLLLYLFLSNKPLKKELEFIVNSYDLEIKVGNEVPIDYQINEDINITWKSDNDSVVTVNNGVITGVGLGDTVVTGTATKGENTITRSINVSTYEGDKNVSLNEIVVPVGELFITVGTTYKIDYEYSPKEAYIKSIEYQVSDNNIIEYQNGLVTAKSVGTTNIIINVNNSITKMVTVNVIEKNITPTFSKKVEDINVISSITLKPNETKEIPYSVIPEDAFIENVKWESNNESIVTISDGIITGKSSGETTITLIINNEIKKEISVKVIVPVAEINLLTNPKLVMKIGDKETIKVNIVPTNATNKKLKYSSSSSNISVSETGVITALSTGTGTIKITPEESDKVINISYTVNPRNGVINGTGGVWGYTSPLDKVPNRADESFFLNLASHGKGTLSNGMYIYNDGKITFKYDIKNSLLTGDSRSVLMRMYYPPGADLSTVNTFAFCNGTGSAAKGFVGILSYLDKNRDQMKSSGIIILIASRDGTSYSDKGILLATEFVKSIVSQKSGVKNAVGAYSGSGRGVSGASLNSIYNRVVVFNSWLPFLANPSMKNKEFIIYSPDKDKLQEATQDTLNGMKKNGYTNVTIVSNNSVYDKYKTDFLLINPGTKMGTGHGYVNIPPTNLFSYVCR